MTVAFVLPSMRTGGAEQVFARLLRAWPRKSDQLHLILLRAEGSLLAQVPSWVRVHDLRGRRLLTSLPRLIALLRRLAPDAAVSAIAHLNVALGLFRPFLRIKRLAVRETSMPSQTMARVSLATRWVYRTGYRRADVVFCPTRAIADQIGTTYGVAAARRVVIANPVAVDELVALSREPLPALAGLALGHDGWVVAVGRLEKVKGYDLLLRAMALSKKAAGLFLVGAGSEEGPLRQLADQLGLSRRVVFTGFLANPHVLTKSCRAFVLSSHYEGLPNAALEALALGVPVVAVPGPWPVADIVVEGVTGWIAAQRTPETLALTLDHVLGLSWNSSDLRAWVREGFDSATVAGRYREAIS